MLSWIYSEIIIGIAYENTQVIIPRTHQEVYTEITNRIPLRFFVWFRPVIPRLISLRTLQGISPEILPGISPRISPMIQIGIF